MTLIVYPNFSGKIQVNEHVSIEFGKNPSLEFGKNPYHRFVVDTFCLLERERSILR